MKTSSYHTVLPALVYELHIQDSKIRMHVCWCSKNKGTTFAILAKFCFADFGHFLKSAPWDLSSRKWDLGLNEYSPGFHIDTYTLCRRLENSKQWPSRDQRSTWLGTAYKAPYHRDRSQSRHTWECEELRGASTENDGLPNLGILYPEMEGIIWCCWKPNSIYKESQVRFLTDFVHFRRSARQRFSQII